jgi:pilus assembly protein CpaE
MSSGAKQEIIKVLIVDDIPDTRENLRKLLAFEPDIQVVGGSGAGTGREAIDMAKEFRPHIVLMDINMPDMDGIAATKAISEAAPTVQVVMMSVQSEPGYLRQAMLAGARDFLTKPISSEELYSTIRRVYDRGKVIYQQQEQMQSMQAAVAAAGVQPVEPGLPAVGAGHIVVVYSPQAGAGTTTIATNLASALMRQDTRVLLIDCNLQFGDVDAFLNLQAQSNIADLTKAVNDIDHDTVDAVLVTHGSGLKVLVAPPHPEQAYDIASEDVRDLVNLLAGSYDFVVVDTPTQYDDMTLKLFDIAERIILIANPTLPSVRNTRKILDIFDSLHEPPGLANKVMFVLNRAVNEKEKGRGTIPTTLIESHLKRQINCTIPLDERAVLTAVNQGVPLVAKQRSRSPGREMVELAEAIRQSVQTSETIRAQMDELEQRPKGGRRAIMGGTN